ncbi:MAG: DUF4280 domain-containing protein [Terriglobia bacterium]
MPIQVVEGAFLMCPFGVAPSPLSVTSDPTVTSSGLPAATIMDFAPLVNIMPFGVCTTVSNPEVAAATAAALGVLTPMPCIPATVAPWIPGAVTVIKGGFPALDNTCKLMCMWGGVIEVTFPGQVTEMIE